MNKPPLPAALSDYLARDAKLPALDGLRGWAVMLVILFHGAINGPAFDSKFSWFFYNIGWSGVDLFFVLSGFLITNVLLRSKNKPHYFRNFYARRVLRIFPLYYAFLAFQLIYYKEPHGFLYHLSYTSNFYLAYAQGIPAHTPAWLTWSLSIEEQFYLLWPLLIYFTRPKLLMIISASLIAIAFLFRANFFFEGVEPFVSYVLTYTRMDTLAWGTLVALILNINPKYFAPLKKISRVFLFLTPVAIWALWQMFGTFYYSRNPLTAPVGFSLTALLYASLLVFVISHTGGLMGIFNNPLTRLLGKHSYAMYLIHIEIIILWREIFFHSGPFQGLYASNKMLALIAYNTLVPATTLLAAWILWHVFEKHFLKLKSRFS